MAEWKISNDLPYLDEFPALYQLSEYPNVLWRQVNVELPYKTCFPEMFDISDAPVSMWRISNDIPYKVSFPEMVEMGAFKGCTSLSSVKFPSTLNSIGMYSFANTALTEVTLPPNCTYYKTSFPEGCKIKGGKLNG